MWACCPSGSQWTAKETTSANVEEDERGRCFPSGEASSSLGAHVLTGGCAG